MSEVRYYLFKIFLIIRYYVDLLIDKLFGLYYDSKRQYIPRIKNPLLMESATNLAKKIRTRKLTSEDVVQAFIDRIKEVNPILNSLVDQRFEDALKEAREIDKDIATGHISDVDFLEKPFLGVPFTTKESTAATGLSWTLGLVKRRGRKATFDAECVASVKKAGGILLGVSNIPQLNMWQETSNPIYGLTKNPYNTTRNVGGSTGGETSLIAACGSPMGIGTDIGGSIRIPSFMCGVFGHKITNNLVNLKGLTFRSGEERDTMVCVGPLVKYSEDLLPFVRVLVGKNANQLRLDEPVQTKNIKVYFVTNPKDPFMSPFREEMHSTLKKAVKHLSELCDQKPEELIFEDLKYQSKLWQYWISLETTNFCNDINDRQGEVNSIHEIIKHFTFGGDFTTATMFNLINRYFKPVDSKWAIETTNNLKEALLSKLNENSVLLYPSAPFPASYHHTALLRPYNFDCFSIWNALRFPVTQVPMGLSQDGMPLGIQVVAAPYQDRLCFAIAKELENGFGGYVAPVIVSDK
ncbi:hypothetical protein ABEB36_012486 [Hypothenemus hampei]|uniref:Amidase domain-containing protein n=1 Tax=Hypothenemus hampei TaxID=57062 RepID=A0ABD1EBD1_HYPHA